MTDRLAQQWADKCKIMDYYFVHRKGKWLDHCFVMIVHPGGGLRIESLWAKLDIEPMNEVQAIAALEAFIECGLTVELMTPQDMPMPRLPGLGTCVSITKRVLGINKPWILTARQLARWIDGNIRRQESSQESREKRQESLARR